MIETTKDLYTDLINMQEVETPSTYQFPMRRPETPKTADADVMLEFLRRSEAANKAEKAAGIDSTLPAIDPTKGKVIAKTPTVNVRDIGGENVGLEHKDINIPAEFTTQMQGAKVKPSLADALQVLAAAKMVPEAPQRDFSAQAYFSDVLKGMNEDFRGKQSFLPEASRTPAFQPPTSPEDVLSQRLGDLSTRENPAMELLGQVQKKEETILGTLATLMKLSSSDRQSFMKLGSMDDQSKRSESVKVLNANYKNMTEAERIDAMRLIKRYF